MKLTKLMLSACVAALALVSCNKQDTTPVSTNNYKSIEISLPNITYQTKAEGSATDLAGTKVQLNTVQFFFTDGTSIYAPKKADGTPAKTYLTAAELTTENLGFHFLPSVVTRVIAVGNHEAITASTVNEIASTLNIATEQDPTNLTLFSQADVVTVTSSDHNSGQDAHNTLVYSVALNLVPRVARIEVKGIECLFSATPLYSELSVNKLTLIDYMQYCNLRTADANTLRTVNGDQTSIFDHFANLGARTEKIWFYDNFVDSVTGVSSVVLTPTAPKKDINIAYNFFPEEGAYPHLLADVIADGSPAYLMTTQFNNAANQKIADTDFKAGNIYRMNFAFKDTDLEHQDRCVEISIDVLSWTLYVVTPIF